MRLCKTLAAGALLLFGSALSAADWPQWRGPNRTEISTETGIRTKFDSPPKLLWTVDNLGSGYSGPAVVGSSLFTLGTDENGDCAIAIDTATGKDIWRTSLGTKYTNDWGHGPRSTPTVDGDRLYVIRGGGGLHCLDAKTGKNIWSKDFRKDFQGQLMSGWGFSESPLIDGDRLICTPGGGGGTLVALDKASGNLIWRSKDVKDAAAYSSVIAADVDGVRQYIQLTGKGVVGVRAQDGAKLWYYERPGHRTAVIPTAVYHNRHVYVTAGYGCGCDLIKLTKDGDTFTAEKVYANKNMVNHHGGVVLLDAHVYGFSDGKGWVCQDLLTGQTTWEEKGKGRPGKGSVTCVAGFLFCYDERTGNLHVVEANPKTWKETGLIPLPKKSEIRSQRGAIWTHPVIANGKLYLRDQDLLFCFDVADSK